jgi:toxin CptA
MAGLVLLLIFVAGYAVQRGTVCAVAAVEALVLRRRVQPFLGFLLCASLALAGMAAGAAAGRQMLGLQAGSTAWAGPLAGGALFGAGAWINGRCALGTIARLGSGEAARLGTLAGFLAGFWLAVRVGLRPPAADLSSPLLGLPSIPLAAAALAVSLALGWTMRERLGAAARADWPPVLALGVIGAVNGALLVLAAGWPYTNLLMALAGSGGHDLGWRGAMAATLVVGALVAAVASASFRPAAGPLALWARCSGGGVAMGVGATLVPGGNATMLLVGLPLLLPNLAIGYAAMTLVLAALVLAAPRSAAA